MYIDRTERYYKGTEACVRSGRFLLLLQLRAKPTSAENTYAVVRRVALRQCGQFMMGHANLCGKWATVSGSYGSDGLPMDVDALPRDAKQLPLHLYEEWKNGGGWNSCGNEATSMRTWARDTFKAK